VRIPALATSIDRQQETPRKLSYFILFIKVGRNRAIIWGTKISKKGISPKNQRKKFMKINEIQLVAQKEPMERKEKKRRRVEIINNKSKSVTLSSLPQETKGKKPDFFLFVDELN
jgi:hypothetical protein